MDQSLSQNLFTHTDGNLILLNGKVPVEKDWVTAPSKINGDAKQYLDLGYNLGFRIPQTHLIIDVDPRNGGAESFKKLPADVQALPHTTMTASGGWHVYTLVPTNISPSDLRTKHKDYPGIDFLHYGKQVVLPGSALPDGRKWELHPFAQFPPAQTPDSLIEILKRERPAASTALPDSAYLTTFELEKILSHIPVTAYQDNDSWLKITMACHHATDGAGLEVFIAWSLQDPSYLDQEQVIRTRWKSMSTDGKAAPITIRTLIKEMAKFSPIPTWLSIRAGFTKTPEEVFENLDRMKQDVTNANASLSERIDAEQDQVILLTKLAMEVGTSSTITESMREILLKKISKKTGASLPAIRKDLKGMAATSFDSLRDVQEAEDVTLQGEQPLTAAAKRATLSISRETGIQPAYRAGQWLVWNRKYWDADTSVAELKRHIYNAVYSVGITASPSSIESALGLMQINLEVDPATFEPDPTKIRIFTDNTVIDVDRSGQVRTQDHHESHRNLSCLPVTYDPNSPEPTQWLSFLRQATTSSHARRTIACSIIYAASHCRPWLRKAFYLYGPKRSGKSTALNAIQDILGARNCSALSIKQIGSRFGGSSLIGKLANISNETVSRETIQDDVFKALVSGEAIEIERKFCDPISYVNTVKMFFGANGFPRIVDESDATWDRLTILSFPSSCPPELADTKLGEKLHAERDQIFNWAMRIFIEEHKKDGCTSIMEMDSHGRAEYYSWRKINNPALQWVEERTIEETGSTLTINAAYSDYTMWCKANGFGVSNKNHFTRHVNKRLKRHGERKDTKYLDVALKKVQNNYSDT